MDKKLHAAQQVDAPQLQMWQLPGEPMLDSKPREDIEVDL